MSALRQFLLFVALACMCGKAQAFDYMTWPPMRWPSGDIPMFLELDNGNYPEYSLRDGKSSWNAVAVEALDLWNTVLSRVQFRPTAGEGRADGNSRNEVFFNTSVYGHRFGYAVLAITTTWRIGTERTEGDTVFNSHLDWDSYRGPIDPTLDLRRVAIHEFGHTLGLDHPDEAHQVVVSIMNAFVSDIDDLQEDDILGARGLYDPPGTRYHVRVNVAQTNAGSVTIQPGSQDGTYAPGTLVTLRARPARGFRFNFWDKRQPASAPLIRWRVYADEDITAQFSSNAAPRIITAPRSQLASLGDNVILRARAGVGRGLTYQWQHNGEDIEGATTPVLRLPEVTRESSGSYRVVVQNTRGSTASKPALLVVEGY